MNTIHIFAMSEVLFALFLWLIVRDHRKKMNAIYQRWEDRQKEIDKHLSSLESEINE